MESKTLTHLIEQIYRLSVDQLGQTAQKTYCESSHLKQAKVKLVIYSIKSSILPILQDIPGGITEEGTGQAGSCESIKEFEDIYQQLFTDEEMDIKEKVEFLGIFMKIFMANGGYSRCQAILDLFKTIFEQNKQDDYVVFMYYCAYLEVTSSFMGLSVQTPEEYCTQIFEDIPSRKFTEEMITELEFRRGRLCLDFYQSTGNLEKCVEINQDLIKICKSTKLLRYMSEVLDYNFESAQKSDENIQRQIEEVYALIDTELATHIDPDFCLANLSKSFTNIAIGVKDKDKEKIAKASAMIEKIVKHHDFQQSHITYNIMYSRFYRLIIDRQSYSRVDVDKTTNELSKLLELEPYERNYHSVYPFTIWIQIQKVLGIQGDFTLVMKYADLLEEDKLSYINYVCLLEPLMDQTVKPYVDKALKFCEDLGIDSFKSFNFNLRMQDYAIRLRTPGSNSSREIQKSLEELTSEYEAKDDPALKLRLKRMYLTLIQLANIFNEPQKYINVSLKYLSLLDKLSPHAEQLYDKVFMISMKEKNFVKAVMCCKKFYEEASKSGEVTKALYLALRQKVTFAVETKNSIPFSQDSEQFENVTLALYSENSAEYIETLKILSQGNNFLNKIDKAYEQLTRGYEIAEKLYETEVNQHCVDIVIFMAVLKRDCGEIDQAIILAKKARELHEQLPQNPISSNIYERILQLQGYLSDIKKAKQLYDEELARSKRNKKIKIAALVGSVGLVVGGALWWLIKKPQSEA
ncbi:unnamed protein product [Moneuplotes crassus]|uniref:Uncharacterized protein n=1 Tax=Euplotes crassus TaxID=5936 RepID=A0AAD1Y8X9_EUPCR|nr:unnamed protein product [Moneuplotes crassus]